MKHILKVEYERTSLNVKNSRIWQKLLIRGLKKEPSTSLSRSTCPHKSLSYRVNSIQVKIINLELFKFFMKSNMRVLQLAMFLSQLIGLDQMAVPYPCEKSP